MNRPMTESQRSAAKETKYRKRYAEILDAAAAVFAEKGYHGASTKDIADRLGIRQGSLYYYFPSKEVALEEVCLIGVDGFVSRLEAIIETTEPPDAKVTAAIANHLEPLSSKRNYVRVFLKERHQLDGARKRNVARRAHTYEELLEGLLRSGVDAGAFRPDLDCRLTVLAILGMCNSTADWIERDQERELEEIADQFSRMVLAGIMLG